MLFLSFYIMPLFKCFSTLLTPPLCRYIKPDQKKFLWEPAVLAIIFCTITVVLPTFFACVPVDCTDANTEGCSRVGLSEINKDDVIRYGCASDEYNPSASLTMRAGEHIVRQLFARGFQYQ